MDKKVLIVTITGIVILLSAAAGAWFFLGQEKAGTTTVGDELGEAAVTITRTKDGYEPKEVTIQKGDVVRWVNESDEFHWPASDLHPTHGVYPAFDPLRPIASGEEWKFKFDQSGTWKYHDHIRANKTGTVTVN